MTDIVKLAEGVAKELADWGATVRLAPEFTLQETNTLRVVVVPVGVAHNVLSRTHVQTVTRIQVGVMKRATEDDLTALVAFCTDLATSFLERSVCGARCMKAEHSPLFVPDHLTERRQFTGVIELSFSEVTTR